MNNKHFTILNKFKLILVTSFMLTACGGGGGGSSAPVEPAPVTTYTAGGSVTGLNDSLTLENNGGDALTISADGSFNFSTAVADGGTYAITVATQPNGQICSISNGSGTVSSTNVTDVTVSCTNVVAGTYTVGGTVSGLSGNLALQNNGGDTSPISADGNFTFSSSVANGAAYLVTVSSQPSGQTCSVSNGSGTVSSANITDVTVSCTNVAAGTYTVGGTVSGLSGNLELQNNGGDTSPISADGNFTFSSSVADGAAYLVTVSSQPAGQACVVSSDSGTVSSANITDVTVSCTNLDTTVTYARTYVNITNSVKTKLTVSTGDISLDYDLTLSSPGSEELISTEYRELNPSDISITTDFRASCVVDSVTPDTYNISQLINITCTLNPEFISIYDLSSSIDTGNVSYVNVDDNGNMFLKWYYSGTDTRLYNVTSDGTIEQLDVFNNWDSNADEKNNMYDMYQDKVLGTAIATKNRTGYLDSWSSETWLNYYSGGSINLVAKSDPSDPYNTAIRLGSVSSRMYMSGESHYNDYTQINNGLVRYRVESSDIDDNDMLHLYDTTTNTELFSGEADNYAVLYAEGVIFTRNVSDGTTYGTEISIMAYDKVSGSATTLVAQSHMKNLCSTYAAGTDNSVHPFMLHKNPSSTSKDFTYVIDCEDGTNEYLSTVYKRLLVRHHDSSSAEFNTTASYSVVLKVIGGGSTENIWIKERLNGEVIYQVNDNINTDLADDSFDLYIYKPDSSLLEHKIASSQYYVSSNPLVTSKYIIYETTDVDSNLHRFVYDGTNHMEFNIDIPAYKQNFQTYDNSEHYMVKAEGTKVYRIDIDKFVELYKLENGL